ncbi:MAG: metal-dependent transcriptional regulator [Candidatus Kariarchaeaceae archaeon]
MVKDNVRSMDEIKNGLANGNLSPNFFWDTIEEFEEEILETCIRLEERGKKAYSIEEISALLKETPESVLSIIKFHLMPFDIVEQVEGEGLNGTIKLTELGTKVSKSLILKHRVTQKWLSKVLGLSRSEAHKEACKLEHVMDDDFISFLLTDMVSLNNTNGCPICDSKEPTYFCAQLALDNAKKGELLRIQCLTNLEKETQNALIAQGLNPGAEIKIVQKQPFGGPILVEVKGSRVALSKDVTCKIFVTSVNLLKNKSKNS